MVMEDHKPLWHITVHLFSLISLIPTDGKLILLCDRLNPINSVCPIFTSPPSYTPCSNGNLTGNPLSERLEGGTLGFKSRREIRRIGTLMSFFLSGELYFCSNIVTENCHSWETLLSFLNHLHISICQSIILPNFRQCYKSSNTQFTHFPSFHSAMKELRSTTRQ